MTLHLWVFPKRYKVNAQGYCPLFLRLSLNGQRAEIALKRFVEPFQWDSKRQIVSGRNSASQSINDQIRAYKTAVYRHYSGLIEKGENVTAKKLKELFNGVDKKRKTIIQAFEFHNNKMEQQIGKSFQKGTFSRYKICLRLLKKFIEETYQTSDYELDNLKLEFITGFDYYLRTVRNCNNNTTVKYLRNLRKIINQARAFEWMNHDPYLNYKSSIEPVNREILSQFELDKLIAKEYEIKRLDQIKDIFIFCCFTGLAYSDVNKLTTDNVVIGINGEKWIQINRTKTGTTCRIPILPIALSIISKYRDDAECIIRKKLLPVPSNQKLNAYLKEIGDLCGIKKKLTSHMARHTFATTIALNNHVPIETVSKMLGHSSIKTTQIYCRVLEGKISEDMSSLMKIYKDNAPSKAINE